MVLPPCRLIVTIDTERDYTPDWTTPASLTFRSVTEAIPRLLTPLFREFGVRPTYFLSPEVIASAECQEVLAALPGCELAPHLHPEYIVPGMRTWDLADPSVPVVMMQHECAPDLERAKLASLTELFSQQFDQTPRSFRAGRFGAGRWTGSFLLNLGYKVESSVTPHIRWKASSGKLAPDFRRAPELPYFTARSGNIWKRGGSRLLEVPITILAPGSLPSGKPGEPVWFRPWYSDDRVLDEIVRYVTSPRGKGRPLVMMFHSEELVPGASPYPQTEADVASYIGSLRSVFETAAALGIESRTLGEYYEEVAALQRRGAGNGWNNTITAAPTLRAGSSPAVAAAGGRGETASSDSVLSTGGSGAPSRLIQRASFWLRAGPQAAIRRLIQRTHPGDLQVPLAEVERIIARRGVQPWFLYAFQTWKQRPEPRETCRWLRARLHTDAKVLEAGCGMAANLIWFSQRGFRNLYGFDSDEATIAAAKDLCGAIGAQVRLWCDEGTRPEMLLSRPYDAILLLNWLYSAVDLDLADLCGRYAAALANRGWLAIEVIDCSYDEVPGNAYLTSDRDKPEGERRPSEYKRRHSASDVERAAYGADLAIADRIAVPQTVPRIVYLLTRR